jgi:hypothetical protein
LLTLPIIVVVVVVEFSGEGSFCAVFQSTLDAMEYCMAAQHALMHSIEWPEALLRHPAASVEFGDSDNR